MRRRPRREEDAEPVGQDSFMDVVANLVGILLIVVMLVGLRTKDVLVERQRQEVIAEAEQETADASTVEAPPIDESAEPKAKLDEASAVLAVAGDIEREMRELAKQIEIESRTADMRRAERTEVQLLLASAKVELQGRMEQLDAERRESLDLVAKVHEASSRIVDLSQTRETIENEADRPTPLPHVPTPMAQTVFGKEIHFRLKDDRLLYVPWDAMIEELQADAQKNMWKLKQSPRIEERIGPYEGFQMEYALVRKAHVRESAGGIATMQSVELEWFQVEPMQEPAGEAIEVALAPGSDFSRQLGSVSPQAYTVTLWVYPDSFDRFREIREALMQRGFLTASRPMPAEQKIGGSPTGSRSVTQ